jgi:hypothetical protein
LIRQCSRSLGVELPRKLERELANIDKWWASIPERDARPPLARPLDLIIAGKNPAEDQEVVATTINYVLAQHGLHGAAAARRDRATEDALGGAADELLSSWATAVQPCGRALAKAVDIGVNDLAQPNRLKGADKLSAWSGAAAALEVLDVAVQGVRVLASVLHRRPPDVLTILSAATPSQLQVVRGDVARTGAHPGWALARNDVTVALADSVAELGARELVTDEGTVEPLADDDPHSTTRAPATVV